METFPDKKRTVVLLRWVLIIAFSYLLLLDASTPLVHARVVLLIVAALASNLVVGRLPMAWTERPVFDLGIVLFDAAWVTLGLAWAPRVSGDLFLLYFLVMFVAAMGESLLTIVASAVVVSSVYAATLSWEPSQDSRLAASALLRVPFLFVIGLFYGYFVTQIRHRRSEVTAAQVRELAKSELLAAVSHDLRGPLGNAEMLLNLVLDGDIADDHDTRVLLLRAQINVRRVVALVTNLLQAAAIEAGTVPLRWDPVRLHDVVDDVLHLEGAAALIKGVTLRTAPCPTLPPINTDFLQVTRIITNLVNNAIKYTPGGGTVTVRTSLDADAVRVSVEDDGPGMTREQCELLFAPYRRVHLGGYSPGTGLGLFIVKRLTEALHGTVTVQSTPGTGSTFTVAFPLPAAAPPLRQPAHQAAAVRLCAPVNVSAHAA